MRFTRPLVVLAALAAVAVSPTPATAAAGGGGSSAEAAEPGFSVSAVGFSSYFRYGLRPGRRARGTIRLVSSSTRPVDVVLLAVDVRTAATGGLDYGASQSRGLDPELKLGRRSVTLSPGGGAEVPFTASVPRSATPGDRFAGIVALNRAQVRSARRKAGKKVFSLRFLPRLAIAVQVTVPGPATHELKLGNVGMDVTPSSTDVTLLLRNTGNKLIRRTGGRLAISHNGRVLVRRRVDIDAFVPATTLLYRVPLRGSPAEGSYRVNGILRPERGAPVEVDEEVSFGDKAARELKRETGKEATKSGPSAFLIAGLIAAVIIVIVLAGALLRTRRRLAAADRRD